MIGRPIVFAAVATVLSLVAAVLDIVDHSATHTFAALGGLVFPVVGLVVARSQPRNTVAWTFLASGMLNAVNHLGEGIKGAGRREAWPEAVRSFGGWCTSWTWFPALFVLITIGLLHFPDGVPITPRWRWVDRAAVAVMGVWIVAVGVVTFGLPSSMLDSSAAPNPDGWRAVVWPLAYASVFAMLRSC